MMVLRIVTSPKAASKLKAWILGHSYKMLPCLNLSGNAFVTMLLRG